MHLEGWGQNWGSVRVGDLSEDAHWEGEKAGFRPRAEKQTVQAQRWAEFRLFPVYAVTTNFIVAVAPMKLGLVTRMLLQFWFYLIEI